MLHGPVVPVNPILYIKPTATNAFVADASDTTAINPPQKQRRHLLFPVGLGILGGAVGGAAGRVVGFPATGATALVANRGRSGPLTADIKLHINGKLASGRLRTLSGDQEEVIHTKRHTRTFSDRWSLVAV
jgi:hypothetical protein